MLRRAAAVILSRATIATTATTIGHGFSTGTATAANLPKPFSKIKWRYRSRVIDESQKALTEYLHTTRSLPFLYADHIARNCPHSLWEIVSKIPLSPSASIPRSLQRFLRYNPINELEFFCESIGLNCGENEIPRSVLPHNTFFLSDWKYFNVACTLVNLGFPWSKLGLLCKDECSVFEIDPFELKKKIIEIKDGYGFNMVCLISICLAFPEVLCRKMDGFLSALKILFLDHDLFDCTDGSIDCILEVCEKIRLFYDLGCEMGSVGDLMGRAKSIFVEYPKEVLMCKIDYFCKLNVQKDQLRLFLLSRPDIFSFDLDARVISVSGFLAQLGLRKCKLKSLERKYPYVFGRNRIANLPNVVRSMNLDEWFFERLRSGGHSLLGSYALCFPDEDIDKHYADNLRKLQAKRTHPHSIKKLNFLHSIGFGENKYAVKALPKLSGNSKELQQRFDCLLRCGIEYSNLCGMVMLSGKILNQQESILEKKIEFLCTEMRSSLQYLNVFPGYLCYDLEKRIKPRYKLHKWLVEQGICKIEYSISTIIASSEKTFVARVSRIHPSAGKKWQENMLQGDITASAHVMSAP